VQPLPRFEFAGSGSGPAPRLFDITMIVMGGIIGSGIFINPYVVARQVPSTILISLPGLSAD